MKERLAEINSKDIWDPSWTVEVEEEAKRLEAELKKAGYGI